MAIEKTKQPGVLFGLSLKITVAVLLGVVVLALILLHILMQSAKDEIEFATAVAGGAAVIYGAYYASVSLRVATKQAKTDAEEKRKLESFHVLLNMHSMRLTRLRRFIEDEVKDRNEIAPKDLHDRIVGEQRLLSAVNATFGLWEDISIGIQYGCLDEDVMFYSLAFVVPWHLEMLWAYIAEEREIADNHMYCEMEKLATAWKDRKSLLTGEEYHWPTP